MSGFCKCLYYKPCWVICNILNHLYLGGVCFLVAWGLVATWRNPITCLIALLLVVAGLVWALTSMCVCCIYKYPDLENMLDKDDLDAFEVEFRQTLAAAQGVPSMPAQQTGGYGYGAVAGVGHGSHVPSVPCAQAHGAQVQEQQQAGHEQFPGFPQYGHYHQQTQVQQPVGYAPYAPAGEAWQMHMQAGAPHVQSQAQAAFVALPAPLPVPGGPCGSALMHMEAGASPKQQQPGSVPESVVYAPLAEASSGHRTQM